MTDKPAFYTCNHIRKNPAIYFGSDCNHDNSGDLYCLLRYLLNVAAGDFMTGHGNRCELSVLDESNISFRSFGRNLTPDAIDMILDRKTADVFEINPVHISRNPALPVKIAVALSEKCSLFTGTHCITFKNGQLDYCKENSRQKAYGFHLYFTPSREIFRNPAADGKVLNKIGAEFAGLYQGMFFAVGHNEHFSCYGLSDLIDRMHHGDCYYRPACFDSAPFSFVFTHEDKTDRKALVFINGIEMQRTVQPLNVFVKGLHKAVNNSLNRDYTEAEVCAGLRVCMSLHTDDLENFCQNLENVVECAVFKYFHLGRFTAAKGLHLKLRENRQDKITSVNDWYAPAETDE